jgi:AraC-like DNA-binding protein
MSVEISTLQHSPSLSVLEKNSTSMNAHQDILFPSWDEDIAQRLYLHEADNKCFIRPGYSIRNLSEETGVQLYKLSAFINTRLGCGFNDYINQFRVKYCTKMMEDGIAKQLTLQALASECGFNNRNTFTSAFKKFTGITPSGFIKKLKR